jgi:hypothetical protein
MRDGHAPLTQEAQMNLHPHIAIALANAHVKDLRDQAAAAQRVRQARRARRGADLLSAWHAPNLRGASRRTATGRAWPGTAASAARPAIDCPPTCA